MNPDHKNSIENRTHGPITCERVIKTKESFEAVFCLQVNRIKKEKGIRANQSGETNNYKWLEIGTLETKRKALVEFQFSYAPILD